MNKSAAILVVSVVASNVPWIECAAQARTEEAELTQLRQELEGIKEGVLAHDRVLRVLIERMKQLQKAVTSQGRPSKSQAQPSAPTAGKAGAPRASPPAKNGGLPSKAPETTRQAEPAPSTAANQRPQTAPKPEGGQAETPTPEEQTRPGQISKPREAKSLEAVRQETNVLFENRLVLEPAFTYSRTDRQQISLGGFLALDAIFIGEISVDEVESDLLSFDFAARYGLTDRLNLNLTLPFLYRKTIYRGTEAGSESGISEEDRTLNFELGDMSAGISYQALREHDAWPDIVWSNTVKAPTGSDPFGVKVRTPEGTDVQVPDQLPSGNGVWAFSTGLSFVKSVSPSVLFGSLSYFHNFEESFDDISSRPGQVSPGSVKLGDSFQFGMGFAVALNERMSFSLSYSQLISSKTETKPDGGEWSKITGSDTNSGQLNFGVTFAANDKFSLVTNIGAGLTKDAPDVQVSFKFPYSF